MCRAAGHQNHDESSEGEEASDPPDEFEGGAGGLMGWHDEQIVLLGGIEEADEDSDAECEADLTGCVEDTAGDAHAGKGNVHESKIGKAGVSEPNRETDAEGSPGDVEETGIEGQSCKQSHGD